MGALKQQLTGLQAEVEAASARLALTRARVDQNMQRVDQLKLEAVRDHFLLAASVPTCLCSGPSDALRLLNRARVSINMSACHGLPQLVEDRLIICTRLVRRMSHSSTNSGDVVSLLSIDRPSWSA